MRDATAMPLFTLDELEAATRIVRGFVPPTPAYAWPLLRQRLGVEVIVKHENHTPTGSFKARGGLVYVEALKRNGQMPKGLVTATRGNHGQSVAVAATQNDLPSVVVVPESNSAEKNAAMAAFGAELVIAGKDFDESRVVAAQIERDRGYHLIPPFHRDLVMGVATYAAELFAAWSDLDVAYVPIGMGSGICGLITMRDLLQLKTEIVGVVAENAPAFALSFAAGHAVPTAMARTFADGMACREPQAEPLAIIMQGAARIGEVSDDEIAEAIRIYYTDTHNMAEGAGAAPLAALMQEKQRQVGKRAGVILCGGNIDMPVFRQVLCGQTPTL
ncbi:threonine dehydratase [Aurantimonas sp. C2-5-R2]|uniref:threonine dehydratase n=2 Tax=Aurantimonas TaxID=182269 RepID=UPI002E18D38D|nr:MULTISPECIES: threonine dehydratase [unclassified Aurantimonas]MEC5292417.1 threonine dehydratase [Aurantimonas sp. C2-3-R2]MEC5413501.1 threonine dehydratase [Aurantimonas sp. C2-4-R8]